MELKCSHPLKLLSRSATKKYRNFPAAFQDPRASPGGSRVRRSSSPADLEPADGGRTGAPGALLYFCFFYTDGTVQWSPPLPRFPFLHLDPASRTQLKSHSLLEVIPLSISVPPSFPSLSVLV